MDDGTRFTAALVYDRLATPFRQRLDHRLALCRNHAASLGWRVVETYVDEGDDALSPKRRPGLNAALSDIERVSKGGSASRVILLIHDFGRLSHDPLNLSMWRHRTNCVGGSVVTVTEENPITRVRMTG